MKTCRCAAFVGKSTGTEMVTRLSFEFMSNRRNVQITLYF